MTKKILLVDDEPDIREVAKISLEAVAGWTVFLASSGREAIEIAERERPDAVLLDVMMPDLDGPSTFEELQGREVTRDIPVLLLTAKVQPSEVRRLEQTGVAGVLSKPFDPMTLHERVAEKLGWGSSS